MLLKYTLDVLRNFILHQKTERKLGYITQIYP